jgi:hypothetical protein
MKSGCSASTTSAAVLAVLREVRATNSFQSRSLPDFMLTGSTFGPRWLYTTTCSTDGVLCTASSTVSLSFTGVPRRQPPSCVSTTLALQSLIRSRKLSAAKPPKTTVCAAPMRAHASIPTTTSGTMPM